MSKVQEEIFIDIPSSTPLIRGKLAKLRAVWKENAVGYLFLAPSLILFSIFLFYPIFQSIYLSLHLTDLRGRIAAFVGLEISASCFVRRLICDP